MAAIAAVLLMTACGRGELPVVEDRRMEGVTGEDAGAVRAGWPDTVAELFDSATAAYSAQKYERAAALYREGARRGPDITAMWFGIYIAEHARGNIAAADSAMAHAQELTRDATVPAGTAADTMTPRPQQ